MAYLFYFVIITEGFTTLAMQIVALRNAVPLVGSSIILTSIVVGVILLALAVGYWSGGRLASALPQRKIIRLLSRLLFISAIYYVLLVFPFQESILTYLVGHMPYMAALFAFSAMFFFIPVALASHTMPMLTELTHGSKGFAAGKVLFFSTLGSFAGSILTSTILLELLGVSKTGYLVAGLLLLCHIVLRISGKRIPWVGIISIGLLLGLFSYPYKVAGDSFVYDSPYQHIEIQEGTYKGRPIRLMLLNGGMASSIDTNTKESWFGYVRAAEDTAKERRFLSSISDPQNVLVIGAAGFTFPEDMAKQEFVAHVDTVDVDPAVKRISEQYFQQKPLDTKISFFPQSARGFLHDAIAANKQYDLILVDAYNGTSIPEELVTKEFFSDLVKLSDHVMLNMIMDKEMEMPFSQHLLTTLTAAWPNGVRYKNVSDGSGKISNFLVTTRPFAGAERYTGKNALSAYTDDHHSIETDKAKMLYGK